MSGLPAIKEFRETRVPPLSCADLGALVGVDRATVHRWETGERKPDEKILPKLSEVTGIPVRELRPDLAERAALFNEAAE